MLNSPKKNKKKKNAKNSNFEISQFILTTLIETVPGSMHLGEQIWCILSEEMIKNGKHPKFEIQQFFEKLRYSTPPPPTPHLPSMHDFGGVNLMCTFS